MRSFRIMQLLNGSQANENNSLALSLYNETLTGDDGQVYEASSNNLADLSAMYFDLLSNNFTSGGTCLSPIANLFSRSDCLTTVDNNQTVWNTTIIVDVCNATIANNEKLFALITNYCAAAVIPPDNDDDNPYAYLSVITTTLFFMCCLLAGVIAGLYYASRNDRDHSYSPLDRSWLRRRAEESEAKSSVIIEELKENEVHEPDGNEDLYDPEEAQQRNSASYARLSTGR